MTTTRKSIEEREKESLVFWSGRRSSYNTGLVLSGIVAFVLYGLVGSVVVKDFEITGFTMFFQGLGYLVLMGIANVFYGLGSLVDVTFNPTGSESFRRRLYNIGFWLSVALPFPIPALLLFHYA